MGKHRFTALLTMVAAALVLVFGSVTQARALSVNDTGTITVNGVENGVQVTGYKVISVNFDYTPGHEQYKNPQFTWEPSVRNTVKAIDSSYVGASGEVTEAFTKANADKVATVYAALASKIGDGAITGLTKVEVTANGDSCVLTDVGQGGYLVLMAGGAKSYRPAAANVVPEANDSGYVLASPSVSAKSSDVPFEKTVNKVEIVGAQYGDTLDFELVGGIPLYPEKAINKVYKMTDKLDKGLTLNEDSVTVQVTAKAKGEQLQESDWSDVPSTSYTVNASAASFSLTVDFDYDKLAKPDYTQYPMTTAYKQVRVKYTAVLNENATIGTTGNKNEAKLIYANDGYTEGSYNEIPDETTTYSYGIDIFKKDPSGQKLAGAAFELSNSESEKISFVKTASGKYRVATDEDQTQDKVTEVEVDNEGNLLMSGLNEGTYYLKETKAPVGYNPINEPIQVVIKDKDGSGDLDGNVDGQGEHVGYVRQEVENRKGFQLPTTGGAGTAMFAAVGVVLVGGGAALYHNIRKREQR